MKQPITIIVSMWNSSTTIIDTLTSLAKQDYPIREIIVIDNHSTDDSRELVKSFYKTHKKINIHLVARDKTYGISASYNLGAKMTKTQLFVTIHSDSKLETTKELEKLVLPVVRDSSVVASYPFVVHPRKIWLKYNFWQKAQFAPVVGTKKPSMNGKFDCYRKKVFLKVKGYDEEKFGADVGSEDADMHLRLQQIGKVVASSAEVIHVHNLNKNFGLKNLIISRKFLARAYGAHIRFHLRDIKHNVVFFLIKPVLGLSILLAFIHPVFVVPFLLFPFVYMKKMFLEKATRTDLRIIVLPFVVWYLVYAESYWMIKSFLQLRSSTLK